MSDVVKVRSITERVGSGDDARVVSASYGETVPEGISTARLRELRDLGAIASSSSGDVPAEGEPVPARPRDRAALDATATGVNPDGGAKGVTGPEDSGSGSRRSEPTAELPDDAPDASQESVGELAGYIDRAELNAAQTVALAEGDPQLAAKVLEAEQTAHGGDARVTVTRPLEKLAARAEPAGDDSGDGGGDGDGGGGDGGTQGAGTAPGPPPAA